MAYAALDSLVEALDRVLDHQHYDGERRRCSHCAFHRNKILQIQFVRDNVVFLSRFLKDFPREAANLEARLSNAAKQAKSVFGCYFFDTAHDPGWIRICLELEKSTQEIDSLLQEAIQIISSSKPRVVPIAKETIVGFEEVLMEIKGRLLGEPSSHLEIMPIVGMGGIGKTTLARHSYQDPSTTHHFDVRAWATVSQNSSAEIILSSLLSSIDPSKKKDYEPYMGTEFLVLHGYRYLKNRRYLIVMDDMWDTNLWDDVRMAFPDDRNGSRIIITTRNLDVASYVDSSNKPHNIQLMSGDQSWRLLKEVVYLCLDKKIAFPSWKRLASTLQRNAEGFPLQLW